MSEAPFDISQANRWFAVELNNLVWNLLERGNLTPDEAERLVHAAHASCHHWLQVGAPANHQRAECLVANAYAAVGDSPAALRHANRGLGLLEAHAEQLADWDWAFTYDALARAHAAGGEIDQARQARDRARELAAKIEDEQDKAIFDQWHAAGNWHGFA